MDKKLKIGIVGLGMVGDPLRRYFETQGFERGKSLFCYDTDPKKNYADNIRKADVIFVTLPTPHNPDGSCNTKIIEEFIAQYRDDKKVFVIKSTIEPGTAERLAKKYKCKVIFNPEFLTEARAWEDMVNPDRQIVAHTAGAKEYTSAILNLLPRAFFSSPGTLGTYEFKRINATEAEIGKYAGNAFGATKVAFGNIFADLCMGLEEVLRKDGINVSLDYNNVRAMVAHDRRIGDSWLDVYHGRYRGFGGYCLPKDLDALISNAHSVVKKLSHNAERKILLQKGIAILEAVRDYNHALLVSQGIEFDKIIQHNHQIEEYISKKGREYRQKISKAKRKK